MVRGAILLLALALLGGLVSAAQAAKDELVLVSRVSGAAGTAANNNSYSPSVSADGRFVAFHSLADNLSGEDGDTVFDVFVRDLHTTVTTLVSRASGAGGPAGDDISASPSISADGRFVAFLSYADNLSADDNDTVIDVFVRDLDTDQTLLVSRASGNAGAAGDDPSYAPSISADGRFVAFYSHADNLSGEDDDTLADVFVRDLQTNDTILVSRASGAAGTGGDGHSLEPSISADGRFVAFSSYADNLSGEDDDNRQDIFVRDLQSNVTTLVSRQSGAGGAGGDDHSFEASLSADGRFVGFTSTANNLSEEDSDDSEDVFVRDLQTNTTTYVSRASGAAGTGGDSYSYSPVLSRDGRFIAFESEADNLSGEDDDAQYDVFVRDLQTSITSLVSRAGGATGEGGNGGSRVPSISADGRFVAFHSAATNLSADSNDDYTNVFVRDILGPPPAPSPPPSPPPPPPPAPPVARDTVAPVVSGFAVVPGRFRVARTAAPRGSRFRFRLSESAAVRIVLERALSGRRVGRRCLKPTPKVRTRPRCARFIRVGTLTWSNRPTGVNSTPFRGRIGARALRLGGYRATITATDPAGNRSLARRTGFRVVRR